jgi:hypothetical protein
MTRSLLLPLAISWLLGACTATAPPAAVEPPSTPKPEQKAERDRIESQKRRERLLKEQEDRIEAASQRQVNRSAESSDLSPYAKEQLSVAQSHSKQGQNHVKRARQHYLSDDFRGVCREFGNAEQAIVAAADSLVPVAREIQIKRPEAISNLLRSGESLAKDFESVQGVCARNGFPWGE